jgi:hypothetical protein
MLLDQQNSDLLRAPNEHDPESCAIYGHLLHQTHVVAERCLDRLERLHERFPADLPGNVVASLREFHAGGQVAAAALGRERRWAPRFATSGETLLIGGPDTPEAVRKIAVLDLSWGGMRAISDDRIAVGSVLAVRPAGSFERPSFAEVRYCVRCPTGWMIGCEFLRLC